MSKTAITQFEVISGLRGFLDFNQFLLFCKLAELSVNANEPVVEIGVFCGRSLAGLACAFEKSRVIGVDPFYETFVDSPAFIDEAEYLAEASSYLSSPERIAKFWQTVELLNAQNGGTLKSRVELRKIAQKEFLLQREDVRYQLCHVDGEHTFSAVAELLDALDSLMHPQSLIVIDDLFNPGFPGISEAVHTFAGYRKSLHPVLYGFNKGVFLFDASGQLVRRAQDALHDSYTAEGYVVRRERDMAVTICDKRSDHETPSGKSFSRRVLKRIYATIS